MNSDATLKKHEDANEYHFHDSYRKWIMEVMEEYAKQKAWGLWKTLRPITLENYQLTEFESWWEANNK